MLTPYCCTHCGFWQRYFETPPECPVCTDARHPLPLDGWAFRTPDEMSGRVETRWRAVADGVFLFENDPPVGIGPCGYLICRSEGNIAFEGASWYSDAALDFIAAQGGVDLLSASHAHVYGALWQLARRFRPEIVVHRAALPFAQKHFGQREARFRAGGADETYVPPVSQLFDDSAELLPGATLHHTGGHTPGHAVLHLADREALFCGDALKFKLAGGKEPDDGERIGRAAAISCHTAFDAHLPLSPEQVRGYRRVLEPLAFDAVYTPWEVIRPGGNKRAALRLFERQLTDRPSADFMPVERPAPRHDDGRGDDPAPVRRYRALATAGEPVFDFPITDLDHTGVPVWTILQWQPDGEALSGVGYGATDERARIGGWGEMAEQILCHRALERLERRTASYADLEDAGVPALDPRKLRLPVTTDYTHRRELQWVEATRWRADANGPGSGVWVPVEAAAAHFFDLGADGPADPLYTPITNGLGAGPSLEHALGHGLLELSQRDGNSVHYRALDRKVGLTLDSVSDPEVRALLDRYDRAGIDLRVKLADDTLGMTNLYVVGAEREPERAPHPIQLTGCGEAADPDREAALRKALLEYAASRARKRFNHGPLAPMRDVLPDGYLERFENNLPSVEEGRSLDAIRDWMSLSAEETMQRVSDPYLKVEAERRFSSLPSVAPGTLNTPADRLRATVERIEDAGMEVLFVNFTPPEAQWDGDDPPPRAVKAIVPGLEVETMTYHRVGPRNLQRLFAMDADFAGRGAPPEEGAHRVPMTAEDEAQIGGPAWFSPAGAEAALGAYYGLYREPDFHVAALKDG
jgi:ribosomal protein S12 methylthiotransferase accessory factor